MLIPNLMVDVERGILETTTGAQGSGQNSGNWLHDFQVLVSFPTTGGGLHTQQHTLWLLSPRRGLYFILWLQPSLQYSPFANGLVPKHQSTTVYGNNLPLQVTR